MQANRNANLKTQGRDQQGSPFYDTSSSATIGFTLTVTPVSKPPEELRERDQWVSWNYEDNPNDPEHSRKPPVNATGRRIDITDPDNYLSWKDARKQEKYYEFNGVGFVFTSDDPYCGVDLDGCRNPDTGEVEAWAVQIIKKNKSYTEVSPSGTGVKIYAKGKKPAGPNKWHPFPGDTTRAIEVYDCKRYFTFTGQALKGYTTIRDAQAALDALCACASQSLKASRGWDAPASEARNTNLSDEAVLRRIKKAVPKRYKKLFEAGAKGNDDESKLDFELACLCAKYIGNDPERIEDLMYESALVRDKWDDRDDYLLRTITRAIQEAQPPIATIIPEDAATEDPDEKVTINVRTAAAIEPLQVEWLWSPYLVRGALNLFDGDPGVGKSTLTLSIVAAALTGHLPTGGDLPESVPPPAELPHDATVLIASAEDDPARTLRPKLDVLGLAHAALARVHIIDDFSNKDGEKEPLDLSKTAHVKELIRHVRAYCTALLIVDPIMAYVGDTDTNRDADVRQMLYPLAKLAEETGCTIVAVRHLAKQAKDRAIYRGGGSIAFAGAARSVLLVGCDPDDSTQKVLVHIKANYSEPGPALRYRVTSREHPTLGGEVGTVEWLGVAEHMTAAQVLAPDDASKVSGSELERAETWLQHILADGPVHADAVKQAASDEGFARITLRRARTRLGVKSIPLRSEEGKVQHWQWVLNTDAAEA